MLIASAVAITGCFGDEAPGEEDGTRLDGGGGVVAVDGVTLRVPSGALAGPTVITADPVDASALPAALGVDPDSVVPGTVFDFGPDGLQFAQPATITLSWDDGLIPPGVLETRLRLAQIDTAVTFLPITQRDTVANTISAEVSHFTWFGVFLPAAFPDSVQVSVAEQVTISDGSTSRAIDPAEISVADQVAVGDQVSVDLGPLALTIEVSEAIRVSDAVTTDLLSPVTIEVSEAIQISDAVSGLEPPSPQGLLYSTAGTPGEVVVVDPVALSVITSIPVIPGVEAIARRPGSSEIWAASRSNDSISVVDAETNAQIATFYSTTLDPIAIAFDDAGRFGYVGDNDADRVTEIDPIIRDYTRFITDFGIARVTDIEVSGDGSTLWAVGTTLGRADLALGRPVDTASVAAINFASDMALSPDESEVWVYDGLEGNVVVFDALSLDVLDTIPVAAGTTTGAESLAFVDSGAGAWASTSTGGLAFIDATTRTITATVSLGFVPYAVVIDPAANLAYVGQFRGADLVVVDLATGNTLGTFPSAGFGGVVQYR